MKKLLLILTSLFCLLIPVQSNSDQSDFGSRTWWVNNCGPSYSGTINDIIYACLADRGYAGSINDKLFAWLTDLLSAETALTDMVSTFFESGQALYGGRQLTLVTNTFGSIDGNVVTYSSAATHALNSQIITSAGEIRNFTARLNQGAPGAGKSFTFVVYVNNVATDISVTVNDSETIDQDLVHTVHVYPEDTISYKITSSGAPSNNAAFWNIEFYPATAGDVLVMGRVGSSNIATNQFFHLVGNAGGNTTHSTVQEIIPFDATVKNFSVQANTAPGGVTTRTFTLNKNGVAQTETVVLSGTETIDIDLSNTFQVTAGDTLSISNASTGSPAGTLISWGITLQAKNAQDFPLIWHTDGLVAGGATTEYGPVNGNLGTSSSVTGLRDMISGPIIVKGIYVATSAAPGSGKGYNFTLQVADADTALHAAVNDLATTNHLILDPADYIEVDDLQQIRTKVVPSGSPSGVFVKASYVCEKRAR